MLSCHLTSRHLSVEREGDYVPPDKLVMLEALGETQEDTGWCGCGCVGQIIVSDVTTCHYSQ